MYLIEKNGKKSYLFGTCHTDKKDITRLSKEAMQAFENADYLLLESIDFEDVNKHIAEKSKTWLQNNPNYVDLVKTLYSQYINDFTKACSKLNFIAKQHNSPQLSISSDKIAFLSNYPPYALMFMFRKRFSHIFYGNPAQQLDNQLLSRFKMMNKPVVGIQDLELVAEKIYQFDLSVEENLLLAKFFLNQFNQADYYSKFCENFIMLKRAYLSDDFDKLRNAVSEEFSEELPLVDPQLNKLLMKIRRDFLNDRELAMTVGMEEYLCKGNAFVAIGASHLPEIVKILSSRGYTVTTIPQGPRLYPVTKKSFPQSNARIWYARIWAEVDGDSFLKSKILLEAYIKRNSGFPLFLKWQNYRLTEVHKIVQNPNVDNLISLMDELNSIQLVNETEPLFQLIDFIETQCLEEIFPVSNQSQKVSDIDFIHKLEYGELQFKPVRSI